MKVRLGNWSGLLQYTKCICGQCVHVNVYCETECDYVSWVTFVLHFQFVLGYLILMEMVSYQEVKLKLCVKLLLKSEKKMLEKR